MGDFMIENRLDQALEFANYRQTLNNQLHKLKVKTDGLLLLAEAGGKFTINQQLICFVDFLIRDGREEAVIFDDYGSPIMISNIKEFLKKITSRYYEVANATMQESYAIKKSRNVKSILDIKDE